MWLRAFLIAFLMVWAIGWTSYCLPIKTVDTSWVIERGPGIDLWHTEYLRYGHPFVCGYYTIYKDDPDDTAMYIIRLDINNSVVYDYSDIICVPVLDFLDTVSQPIRWHDYVENNTDNT